MNEDGFMEDLEYEFREAYYNGKKAEAKVFGIVRGGFYYNEFFYYHDPRPCKIPKKHIEDLIILKETENG